MTGKPMTLLDLAYDNARRMKTNAEKVSKSRMYTRKIRMVRECQLWWCVEDAACAYRML